MRASAIAVSRDFAKIVLHSPGETERTGLSPADRDHLGEQLRAMYNELRDEPLPEHLQDLVNRIAQSHAE